MKKVSDWHILINKKSGLYAWEVYSWQTQQSVRGATGTLRDAQNKAHETFVKLAFGTKQ